MAQPRRYRSDDIRPNPGLRPGQDVASKSATNSFPTVGMTLRSYNNKAASQPRRNYTYDNVDKKTKKGKLRRIFSLKHIIITLVAAVLVIGGLLGFNFAYNIHKLFGGSIFGIFSSSKLKGQDSGRINILIAGNSADDPGHNGANLTDSIMVISINTKNNTAFMLSIPRDLYVNIPGNGYGKINEAYVDGQASSFTAAGYPNGGMGQLEQVVSQDLGIPIDYYALVDYSAIRDAVNAVGGINVNIQSSDPRGLYDPSIDYSTHGPLVKLTNGVHTLDGQQALDLARARGDTYGAYGYANSDFERTANQRLMLVALKQKATSAGVLANPVTLSKLFNTVGSNVKTDLTLGDVRTLYSLAKPINSSNITSASFQNGPNGQNLLASYVTSSGQDALIPAAGVGNYTKIQHYVQQLISNNPVVKENAPIALLNATSDSGLAGRQQTIDEAKGLNIVNIGDAVPNLAQTEIVDNSKGKYPATRSYLKTLYNATFVTNPTYTSYYPNAAFIVMLGQDQVAKDSTYSTGSATASQTTN
ncbi:MAG TPA: LCP family protein [Candidatus Saccharimonadales bacterium]